METVKKVSSKFEVSLKDVLNLDDISDLRFYKLKVDETDTSELIEFVAQNIILPSKNGFYDFERLLCLNWKIKPDGDNHNFAFLYTHKPKDKSENANNKYVNGDSELLLDRIMSDLEIILAKLDEYMFKSEDFLALAKTCDTENRSVIGLFKNEVLGWYASKFGIYIDIDYHDTRWQIKKISWNRRNADKNVVFNYESVKKYCISKGGNGITEFVKYKADNAKNELNNEKYFINLFTAVFTKIPESKQKNGLFDKFEKCLDECLKSNGKVSEAWSTFYDNVICNLIPKEVDDRTRNAIRKWCNSFAGCSEEVQSNILIMIKDIINGNWRTTMIETNITLTELQQSKVQKTDENIKTTQIQSADNPTVQNKSENLIYVYEANDSSNQKTPLTFDTAVLKMANTVFDNMKQDDNFSNFVDFALGLKKQNLVDFINVIHNQKSSLEEKQKDILNDENGTGFKVIVTRLLFFYFDVYKKRQSTEIVAESDLNGLKDNMKQAVGELCKLGIINDNEKQGINSEVDAAYSLTMVERILGKLIRFVGRVWLYFALESSRDKAKSWMEYSDEKMVLKKVFHSQIYKDNNFNEHANAKSNVFSFLQKKITQIPVQQNSKKRHYDNGSRS